MEPQQYIMTDALICGAIAEFEGMTVQDRVNWIEDYITRRVEPYEREIYVDQVLNRMDKMKRVKVD